MSDDAANPHGLRRSDLDEGVKRAVRQRCRFGCVVCGSAIVQYHHFDPPFADATAHLPDGITLLCGHHHDLVTRGLWSDARIRKHNARPARERERPHHLLDLTSPIQLVLGSMWLHGAGPLISFDDEEVLGVEFVEGEGALLNARFFDSEGRLAVEIRRNELLLSADSWDAKVVGRQISVGRGARYPVFEATIHPPHGLYVRRLHMNYRGMTLDSDEHGRFVTCRDGAPSFRLRGDYAVLAGHIKVPGTLTGGAALIPYPGERFARLASKGSFGQLERELVAPMIHVDIFRPEKRPLTEEQAAPIAGAPAGHTRFRIFCDVCNETECGTRDVPVGQSPPQRSGIVCQTCAALPHAGWCVHLPSRESVPTGPNREDAIKLAVQVRNLNPSSRVGVHRESGGIEGFLFAD